MLTCMNMWELGSFRSTPYFCSSESDMSLRIEQSHCQQLTLNKQQNRVEITNEISPLSSRKNKKTSMQGKLLKKKEDYKKDDLG